MEKYYHFTSYDNLRGIAKLGLIPQIGERSKSINDDRCAVFLSQGMRNAIYMYTKMQNHYEQLKKLNKMLDCKTFNDFMKDGCYLSVSDIDELAVVNLDDCYSLDKINPTKINVVTIRNKEYDEIYDSREIILNYFLSTIEQNEFIKSTRDIIGQKLIADLYNARYEEIFFEYNNRNYLLEEIPITEYVKIKKNNINI